MNSTNGFELKTTYIVVDCIGDTMLKTTNKEEAEALLVSDSGASFIRVMDLLYWKGGK